MFRTTIMLPSQLKSRAAQQARKNGLTLGEFVRRALENMLQQPGGFQADEDVFWADKRVFGGRIPGDLARKHDDYLYGGK